MSWRDVIETPSQYSYNPQKDISRNTGNNENRSLKNFSCPDSLAAEREKHNSNPNAHNSHNPQKEMPTRAELAQICRLAVAEYPDIDPERLRRFLECAEDPAWCSERVARHIARRMAEGLIREPNPYPRREK